MAYSTLPEEITLLILSWLPVKSLLRFACVSKRFHSIILSDPEFAKSQLQAARERKALTQRLLYNSCDPQLESFDLFSPSLSHRSSARKHSLPFATEHDFLLLLGSCNGIVMLALNRKVFYAWNPLTSFFKKLDDPDNYLSRKVDPTLGLYGVGYLPATDDYKVLVVFTQRQLSPPELTIFSSKAKAWKTLNVVFEFDASDFFYEQGCFVKEALHWLYDNNQKAVILAFDLSREENQKFTEIMLPWELNDFKDREYKHRVGVSVGGNLCLVGFRFDVIDVWVMEEYGVRESWTKLFTVKSSLPVTKHWRYYRFFLLETCIVADIDIIRPHIVRRIPLRYHKLAKIGGNEEDICSEYERHNHNFSRAIQYHASLMRLED